MKILALFFVLALLTLNVCASVVTETWEDPETQIKWVYSVDNNEATIESGARRFRESYYHELLWEFPSGEIKIPKIINGYTVTRIGRSAFENYDAVTSVEIQEGVREIDRYAFSGCVNMQKISIPHGVTNLGYAAFESCEKLTSIVIPSGVVALQSSTFYLCKKLSSVTFPQTLRTIGRSAFSYCEALAEVNVPYGVLDIGEEAFRGCKRLVSFEMPTSVSNVSGSCFCGCESLVSIQLPFGITNIAEYAFLDCTSLTELIIPNSVETINGYALLGCIGLRKLTLPFVGAARGVGDGAELNLFGYIFGWKSTSYSHGVVYQGLNDRYAAIPQSLREVIVTDEEVVGRNAFYGCSMLTNVVLNEGVKSVENYSFYNCSGLKRVDIPAGLTDIRQEAFGRCLQLSQVYIPSSVQNIEYLAFDACPELARVVLPIGVGYVDSGAFPKACKVVRQQNVVVRIYGRTEDYDYNGVPSPWFSLESEVSEAENSICLVQSLPIAVNVAHYELDVKQEWFANTNDAYIVEFVVANNARFDILPRNVVLISGSASKVYDGQMLACAVVDENGFVNEECEAKAVGAQTLVGSSKNTIILNWKDGASPSNYNVTITEGTLTVLPAKVGKDGMEPGAGVAEEGGLSKYDTTVTYDGLGHTIDTKALMSVTLVADTPVFSYSLTSNGVFRAEPYCFTNACVTSVWYKISAANYEDYVHEARVTILPREVTLTSGAAQKKYDGNPLTSNELIVGGNAFVGDDGVTWTCTGSQTEVGSSENTFEYAFKDGTLASNYNITKQYGTLTVEYAGVTSSPRISPSEFFGDSGEVTIDCEMVDAVIHYTLDGTTPTEASAVYEGPITIPAKNGATVVRAIAVRHGWMPSEVAEQRIVSLTPPDGSGNAVTNAAAVCHADNAGVLDITYDVAGNSSNNRQKVEVVVSVCGTNLTYVVADGSVSDLGAAGRHTVTVDFSSVLNAAKGYSYVVKVGGSSVEVPNWAAGKEGLLVKDNWVYGHTDSTIRDIEIPDGVVGIAAGAFAGCVQLETVSLPLTLRRICDNAFTMDTHLTSIVLPEGLEFIGEEAFYGCTKMANVIVPGTVKFVGSRAFRQCTALTNAQIAYGVESIGDECFYSDWRISEVDLPSTVTNIGKDAFGGDSSIIRAGLRCDVRKMSEIFSNYQHIREIIVKEGDGEIVDGCFKDCEELKDVRYMGNCPALEGEGRELYANTFVSNTLTLVSYVLPESTGWDGVESSDQLPQAWPLVGGYRRPIAHWDVPTYLCRFDSNGGTLGVQDTYQYSEQDVVLPPEPVQSGYRFAGWWTQPVGGLRVTEKTIFIEGVYTYLWAHWVKGHTVFLDPNGGVVINGFVTYVDESVYGVLPMPVRSGYAFDGWLYNNEKIRPDTKINEMADHTLTAQWTANQYKVQYRPNGGTGDLVVEDWVYGETNCLRRNAFVREGYVFIGWATEEGSDEVVYRDCEPVANLTTEDGVVVELWAVWQESDAVDPTNVELSFGGEANWEKVYELVSAQMDGHVVCTPSFWRSGKVADNEQSDMRTEVFGAGTIGFWWKVSCEQFRQEKLDHLSFVIDGVEQTWINGETDWAYVEFRVDEVAAHEFVWRYEKDWMDFDGDDRGSVCAVVWTPRLETLEDYAGTTNLTLVTSGDAEWYGVTNVTHNQSGSVRSGKIVDGQESRLEALVEGEGVVEFWWKTDCERFRDYKIDRVAFYVDGIELAWTNGVMDWQHQRFKVLGAGMHTLLWVYIKDGEGTAGEDCAWVSEINWIPAGAKVAVPSVVGDEGATVTGDAETGFVVKPSEGKTAVEVTIPQGVDAAKVTVEVSVKVTIVKPHGAKVKIISGGTDITEFLNVPAADGNGVVDLTKATVKEEIVKETMDVEKGAKIELNAANPTLITPNTRMGLFYQLREGTTLEGMSNGDSTIGDGNPWKPEIKVKGGNSAFYSIGVEKGE